MTHPLHYNWVTEANGLGPAYRLWLTLPRWLPLPVYGDHGVCYLGSLDTHELHSRPRVHFTWGRSRHEYLLRAPGDKTIVRIPCPWIMFRRASGIERAPDATGTLVFIPHSLPNLALDLAVEDYVRRVMEDSAFPGPYTLILHPHDAAKGLGTRLEALDCAVHCFGSNQRPEFIANFYETASRHSHAVSCRPGSELHYCHELGLVFREVDGTFRERILDDRIAATRALQAEDVLTNRLLERQAELFRAETSASDAERDAFVADTLSLDLATEETTAQIRALVGKRLLPECLPWLCALGERALTKFRPSP